LKLYHHLNTSFDEDIKGNYLIIQKIQENIPYILESDFQEELKGYFQIMNEKCSYILENKENKFSHEIKNQMINEIYSFLSDLEFDISKESQNMMEELANNLGLKVVDLRKEQ